MRPSAQNFTPEVKVRKYYIAGPMRGYPEFNFPAFDRAADYIRARGSYAFNPADRDRAAGFDPTGLKGNMEELVELGFDLRAALDADFQFILWQATHIFMLPGWSSSKGATAERALALVLGLTVEGSPS